MSGGRRSEWSRASSSPSARSTFAHAVASSCLASQAGPRGPPGWSSSQCSASTRHAKRASVTTVTVAATTRQMARCVLGLVRWCAAHNSSAMRASRQTSPSSEAGGRQQSSSSSSRGSQCRGCRCHLVRAVGVTWERSMAQRRRARSERKARDARRARSAARQGRRSTPHPSRLQPAAGWSGSPPSPASRHASFKAVSRLAPAARKAACSTVPELTSRATAGQTRRSRRESSEAAPRKTRR
mmetsp:Transcript_14570/g.46770  ORF Transcript_14570/g.46770 Transcript_14570/m.46770 type:complete len:241 (+) Transcript_14570:501-1223(+)